MALNLAQWGRVLPYCTGGGLWGPLGAFGGHFGPFQAISGHLGVILGPRVRCWGLCWSLFLICLATQNDLDGYKSGTVGQGITIGYWWGPLGPFWVILE